MSEGTSRGVSVIVPFRDAGPFLAVCCRSILAQTYREWEVLLVEDSPDGSTDGGTEVARCFLSLDSRFRLLHSKRQSDTPAGPWWPRNVGLAESRHELIAFLDADDVWHPHKLAAQIQAFEIRGWDLCTTAYFRFNNKNGLVVERRNPAQPLSLERLKRINTLPLSTVMVRRELIKQGFRPVIHEDYQAWVELFTTRRIRYENIPEALMAYRLHDGNLTGGILRKMQLRKRQLEKQQMMEESDGISRELSFAIAQLGYAINSIQWRILRVPISQMGFITM